MKVADLNPELFCSVKKVWELAVWRWRCLLPLVLSLALVGCGTLDRLAEVGVPPRLSPVSAPPNTAALRGPPRRLGTNRIPSQRVRAANTLWRPGSRAFFKDQRARAIGDILTVKIAITDQAKISNSTARSRNGAQSLGLPALGGFEKKLTRVLPDGASAPGLINTDSASTSAGEGSVNRSESLTTQVAATVVHVLPNGNLVIDGKQEVRVNFEVRELIVAGIVRPEDIEASNTIDANKIAEARISYGGRGQISDVQQPRVGQQVLDILLPF